MLDVLSGLVFPVLFQLIMLPTVDLLIIRICFTGILMTLEDETAAHDLLFKTTGFINNWDMGTGSENDKICETTEWCA